MKIECTKYIKQPTLQPGFAFKILETGLVPHTGLDYVRIGGRGPRFFRTFEFELMLNT